MSRTYPCHVKFAYFAGTCDNTQMGSPPDADGDFDFSEFEDLQDEVNRTALVDHGKRLTAIELRQDRIEELMVKLLRVLQEKTTE